MVSLPQGYTMVCCSCINLLSVVLIPPLTTSDLCHTQAREDGHAFLAPSRVAKKKFSSGIDTSMTIRIEKPQNNMERRLLSWRSTPQ